MFDEIKKLWDVFEARPVPSGAFDVEVSGMDLISMDTFSAGCISVYVENFGKLDGERINVLRRCSNDIDAILSELSGEMKDYFAEISKLSHMVLESLN